MAAPMLMQPGVHFPGAVPLDCHPGSRKKFSPEEDDMLRRLVTANGEKSWNEIAAMMRGRTARQVRERYQHYLNPTVNVGSWTPEEDALLLQMFEVYGPQWSILRQFFNSRSCVNIKNRWTTLVSQARKAAWEHGRERPDAASTVTSPVLPPIPQPPQPMVVPASPIARARPPAPPLEPLAIPRQTSGIRRQSSTEIQTQSSSATYGDNFELKLRKQSSAVGDGTGIRRVSSTNVPFGSEVPELSFGYTGFDDVFGEFVW
jgi:hypothetical protein